MCPPPRPASSCGTQALLSFIHCFTNQYIHFVSYAGRVECQKRAGGPDAALAQPSRRSRIVGNHCVLFPLFFFPSLPPSLTSLLFYFPFRPRIVLENSDSVLPKFRLRSFCFSWGLVQVHVARREIVHWTTRRCTQTRHYSHRIQHPSATLYGE